MGKAVRRAVIQAAVAVSLVLASACVPTPPPKLPEAPQVPKQQKMAWILRLEDQRLLRVDLPRAAAPTAPGQGKETRAGRHASAAIVFARLVDSRARR